jgi:sirohydrochlorin ferrochelatase
VSPAGPLPTLLAVAHGSRNPTARQSVDELLVEVHRQRPDITAHGAFLDHAEPRLGQILTTLDGPAVVVPLLLTAAFHTDVDLPAQLAASPVPVVQARALGPHPLLLRALERRLSEAGVAVGDPGVAVVLAAAGSSDPRAVAAVAALAQDWSTTGWWDVVPAYASAAGPAPEVAVADLRGRGAPRVAVATYLLSPGLFADKVHDSGADVVSGPLGAAPEVAAVVIERYDAARVLLPPARPAPIA